MLTVSKSAAKVARIEPVAIKNAAGTKTIAIMRVKTIKAQFTEVAEGVVRTTKITSAKNDDMNADVNKAAGTIRIFGIYNGIAFDKTLSVGQQAEYSSYNMSYYGRIVAIGPKTVIIKHYEHSSAASRLKLAEFIWRNYDFELATAARRNAEWND